MMCIQLDSFAQVEQVSRYCATQGVLIDWFLHCETAMRIAPPLTITEEQIAEACAIILAGLSQLD